MKRLLVAFSLDRIRPHSYGACLTLTGRPCWSMQVPGDTASACQVFSDSYRNVPSFFEDCIPILRHSITARYAASCFWPPRKLPLAECGQLGRESIFRAARQQLLFRLEPCAISCVGTLQHVETRRMGGVGFSSFFFSLQNLSAESPHSSSQLSFLDRQTRPSSN